MPQPLKNLKPGEIEVFRAGKYPQGTYTTAQVQEIVDTYDADNEHRAWLGVTHKPAGQPEGRAYGVFDSLRREGDSVVAKFAPGVDPAVKRAFTAGEVASWSAEVYPDYKGTGKPYLKAVKLLGSTPPAIKGLKANLEFSEDDDAGECVAVTFAAAEAPPVRRTLAERIGAAIAPLLPSGSAHEFDEEDDDMPKGMEARFAEFERRATAAEERAAAAEERAQAVATQFAESQKTGLQREVDTFAEAALKDGKLTKGDDEGGVRQFMASIDGVTFDVPERDEDGKPTGKQVKRNARQFFAELVKNRVTAVPLNMVSGDSRRMVGSGKVKVGAGVSDSVNAESVQFEEQVVAFMEANPKATPEAARAAVIAEQGNPYHRD